MTNFKKKMASALAVVTLFTASATSLTASASNFLGDLNNDNKVDNTDVTLLERYFKKENVNINRGNADINGDGRISIADLVSLKKMNVTNSNKGSEISCTAKNNTVLSAGQKLTSPDGKYYAIMQYDGNFVVYYNSPIGRVVVWHTYTAGNSGAFLALQQDGNLVVYSEKSKAIWYTRTGIRPFADYKLSLGNDGILRLTRKSNNQQRWCSKNNPKEESKAARDRVNSGHLYSTMDEAAKDFIIAYNGISVCENREYGTSIAKVGNKYKITEVVYGPVRTNEDGDLGEGWDTICNAEGDLVAYVHTHGQATCSANLVFSPDDMNTRFEYAYLGNAYGEIYRYKEGDPQYSYDDYYKKGIASGDKIATLPQYVYLY